MFDALRGINMFAVLLASLATFVLGGIWYMGLFKKAYATALGRTDLADQTPSALFIVGPFVCGVVVNLTDAVLLRALKITSVSEGLIFGATVGLGFLVAMTVNISINPNFPRPFFYSLISGGYFFVGSLIACPILVAMA